MPKKPFPNPTRELSEIIGRVSIHFSHIEHLLHSIVPGLLNGDGGPSYALSRNLGNRSLTEFFLVLTDGDIDDDLSDGLKKIAKEFDRLLMLRNRLVHNLWLERHPKDRRGIHFAAVSRFKGKIRFLEEVWDIADIKDFLVECHEFQSAVYNFTLKHDLMIPTLEWQDSGEYAQPHYAELQSRDPAVEEWMHNQSPVPE